MKKSGFYFASCAVIIGCLAACSTLTHPPAAYTGSPKTHKTLVNSIKKHHVQVIEMGQQVLIIVPIDQVFILQSQEIDPSAQGVFNIIAQLIKTYPNASIAVRGYVDNLNLSPAAELQQSKDYANIIGGYLWNAGIPKEQISIQGLGATNSVAAENTSNGRVDNRRVEIQIYG